MKLKNLIDSKTGKPVEIDISMFQDQKPKSKLVSAALGLAKRPAVRRFLRDAVIAAVEAKLSVSEKSPVKRAIKMIAARAAAQLIHKD